jgi:type 1 glutamine amidotransferase
MHLKQNLLLLTTCALIIGLPFHSADAQTPATESFSGLTFLSPAEKSIGKKIVLIAAEQEYRSEQSMPMLAKILSSRHGFDCTVLFAVNPQGQVDPTMPVYPEKGKESEFQTHNIPGLDHLKEADLVIFFARLLTLPLEQQKQIVSYIDSGKPIIGLRTANHGFRGRLPYKIDGKQIQFGEQVLGGTFRGHHGNWHRDSTRGDIVEAMKDHPILTGVANIWGPSDVYRTFPENGELPSNCTALVYGQPLIGRKQGGESNPNKIPLPVIWTKPWKTSNGKSARVFHSTMGSGKDFENEGFRRCIVNACYWCTQLEDQIPPQSDVSYVDPYTPFSSGFNYEKLGVTPKMPTEYRTP